MITKPYKHVWIALLMFIGACGKQTAALPKETPMPTAVSSTLIPTSTIIPVTITPSPLPTQPSIPMITPDPVQVERWREYENALARTLSSLPPEEVICEWEILGRSDQKVYVWATCDALAGGRGVASSAVIHLNADGTVQSVEKPGSGSKRISNILKMFPSDIQEIILNNLISYHHLSDHLEWRQEHPDEPPLIVLSATPMP